MRTWVFVVGLSICLSAGGLAQPKPQSDSAAQQSQTPPPSDAQKARERDAEAGESSSRDTRIDISPPKDDAKDHPNSGAALSGATPDAAPDAAADVQELQPWNPYRAVKDEEVGDYYFKRKNYKAALARYQDALTYKENDAVANFRMAQCFEKLGQLDEATMHYQEYLRILPQGPLSKDARKTLEKLGKRETSQISPKQ